MSVTSTRVSARTESRFDITGAPDVKVAYTLVTIRPDRAVVIDDDGHVVAIEVEGPRVLKSGEVSPLSRNSTRLYAMDREQWPDWLVDLAAEAVAR